jgi:hypothetical protein
LCANTLSSERPAPRAASTTHSTQSALSSATSSTRRPTHLHDIGIPSRNRNVRVGQTEGESTAPGFSPLHRPMCTAGWGFTWGAFCTRMYGSAVRLVDSLVRCSSAPIHRRCRRRLCPGSLRCAHPSLILSFLSAAPAGSAADARPPRPLAQPRTRPRPRPALLHLDAITLHSASARA